MSVTYVTGILRNYKMGSVYFYMNLRCIHDAIVKKS